MFVIKFEFDVDCNVVRLTAKLYTEGDEPPQSFLSFTVVNYNSVYEVATFWHCLQQMFGKTTQYSNLDCCYVFSSSH